MADILYSTDGCGRWFKREFAAQCRAEVFFYGRCQGVSGHTGVHWCYGLDGSFRWSDNKLHPQHGGCAGSTPPDHKDYVPPTKMAAQYFLSHHKDSEVKNKALIARLERDETKDGESITRPVSEAEEEWLRRRKPRRSSTSERRRRRS
jgi:tRNA (cmo5U34)-methyltransferase